MLVSIQANLKAPKAQMNDFGGYKYRSTEDILEAVKPLLVDLFGDIILSDELQEVAGRVYVKATAKLSIWIGGDNFKYESSAFAEQALQQKGMNTPQLTISASSFARKQALQGLFAIDDSYQAFETQEEGAPVKTFNANDIKNLLKETDSDLSKFFKAMKKSKVEEFSRAEIARAGVLLVRKLDKINELKKAPKDEV